MTQATCDWRESYWHFAWIKTPNLDFFLVVDVPEFLHLLQCCADTWNVTCWLCLLSWTPSTNNNKNVSTLNALFYYTSCGSLQIPKYLQTHDLYATHTEDHVGKKTIGKCTETNNKLPLTQFCCQISWLLCDSSVLVCVLNNILISMNEVIITF